MSKSTGIFLTEPDAAGLERSIIEAWLRSPHRMTVTLVYPGEANPDRLRISVLSSFGRALIGARVGDVIRAGFADFASGKFRVAELVYQPEAAGRFDL